MLLSSTSITAASNIQNETCNTFELFTSHTIYVDDNNTLGPWDGSYEHPFLYIHDGILHATDGDTISVFNGIYEETVILNKSINFQGQQQNSTIIDGKNNGSVIIITSDNVSIKELTIRNSGCYKENAGIIVIGNTATIAKCTIYRTHTGISVHNKSGTIITNCRFHTNGYGIVSTSLNTNVISLYSLGYLFFIAKNPMFLAPPLLNERASH